MTDLGRWKNPEKKKGAIFWTGPVLAGGKLWVANTEGQVMRVDVADGTAAPFAEVKAPVSLAPIVANQTLYVLDDDGTIHAFR
jgi:outer membrane protein assembly factor BamB